MDKKKIIELKDQRAKLITDMRELNTPDMSEEQLASYNKMDADFDAISATIAREEKLLEQSNKFSADFDGREVEKKIEAATAGDKFNKLTAEQEAEAMGAWLRFNRKSPNDDQRKYAQRLGLDFNTNAIEVKTLNTSEYGNVLKFAQSATQGDKGGYLVPDTLMGAIEIARIEHGNVRQVAQVIRTDSGGDLSWPTVDDTANAGAAAPENSERSTTDLTLGKKTWGAYTYTSNFIKVPFELLEDSAINLVQLIGEMMGERLAETEGQKFTTGTGAGEPQGIVTGAAAGNTTAGATAITLNELQNLAYTVGSYYRRQGLDHITWTYDPLLSRNAHLNIVEGNPQSFSLG
jgi:HK97 family phage major capsid protein